jgi:hypothetical protein
MATRESDDGDDIMRILEESDTRAINFSKRLFPGESSKFLLNIPEIYSCPKESDSSDTLYM